MSDRVTEAFAATPREGFLPESARSRAGADSPLPIGFRQTNSQPRTVADMLELLDVTPGMGVLDVGSGSGWTTALLAHLTGPSGRVIGTEIVPELCEWGRENLAAVERPWARIENALPDRLGWPDDAPYERILVSAEARELPGELVGQLAAGGVLVAPVDGRMLRVIAGPDGAEVTQHGRYRFVPLISPPAG